ncbi:MAG: hypothetical protein KKD05_07305 [Candidatus Omnitrophica bacterium]|nr:hypothetical protein [Candidatus Omnitrophota bacterium]
MADKNNLSRSISEFLKPFIIAVIIVIIAWILGKGVLTLISSLKQM